LSLTISDANGVALLDTHTEQQEMPDFGHSAAVKVHLGPIVLPGGEYFVDVGAYARDWGHVYDYHWHVYPLLVVDAGRGDGSDGSPRWELLTADGPDQEAVVGN
jgi:lipopolysaccharide transport system ATP-binding protein